MKKSKSRATKTPLVFMFRRPGVSIDVNIAKPRSLSNALKSFIPQMAHMLSQTTQTPPLPRSPNGGRAGASLVDFMIDDLHKLAPSNEDLDRLQAAIQSEIARRQDAS